ncbi:riboflavin synthase subunit beta [gut metagenome]|uniref:6,7-dimethyl-8-ribityllumazine synthase n=1 Tax=gut metagenome TaxID=749906 RepID=J9CNK7_9ZZZZ
MSSQAFSFQDQVAQNIPNAADMRFAIVVSEWNNHITDKLMEGAHATLLQYGAKENNIHIHRVPGSYELVFGASQLAKSGLVDAIIAIGCVVRGDTPHFDYICEGTTQGLTQLNTDGNIPVIFGLITVNTMEQAEERAGGNLGNKGNEFAVTAIKMVNFAWQLKK